MLRHATQSAAGDADHDSLDSRPALTPHLRAVHLRNYDHMGGHSVHVHIETGSGREVASERHYLLPGQSAWVTGPLDPGRYHVRVWVDGVERRRIDCRLDESPTGAALIELGNGVVSVTTGEVAATAD